MFIDSVKLTLRAGTGGNGVVAWRREKYIPKGGPSGGNGGQGGSIHLVTDSHVLSLESFRNKRLIRAEDGMPGAGNLQKGRNGSDLVLKVPPGTLVKELATGKVLFDFTEENQKWTICEGGRGGKGNACFKSPTHQAPIVCTPGTEGESIEVELELKLIADVGLVGMPNAGKSTLMKQITHVPVKIAPYPFTTLYPNLSYVQFDDYSRVLVADIPGLIKDAHCNRGLGISFLKHVERSSVLLYVIDISGQEGRDPFEDFTILQDELRAYRADLLEKPFLVALNKIDVEGAAENLAEFTRRYPYPAETLFPISAMQEEGVPRLLEAVRSIAQLSGKHF
ncbi:MAG: GTPase ObgE [Verrucomicrobia bacterium]|nr:GTPase ObgE [Verrucomicrobiota bacterium]